MYVIFSPKKNNNNIYSEYNQGSKSYLKLAEGTADGGPVKWHHEKSQRENTGHPVRQLAWTFQKINDVYIKKIFWDGQSYSKQKVIKELSQPTAVHEIWLDLWDKWGNLGMDY